MPNEKGSTEAEPLRESERGRAQSQTATSTDTLNHEGEVRLSHPFSAHHDLVAKLQANYHNTKKKVEEFIASGYKLYNKAYNASNFIEDIARLFGMRENKHGGNMRENAEGHYFSQYRETARGYSKNVKAFYINIPNLYIADFYEKITNLSQDRIDELKKQGYDGAIFEPWKYDKKIESYYSGDLIEYVAFSPEQIKSADAFTYDDEGNHIPLNKRMSDNEDIRFSYTERAKQVEDANNNYNNELEKLKKAIEKGSDDYEKAKKDFAIRIFKRCNAICQHSFNPNRIKSVNS